MLEKIYIWKVYRYTLNYLTAACITVGSYRFKAVAGSMELCHRNMQLPVQSLEVLY